MFSIDSKTAARALPVSAAEVPAPASDMAAYWAALIAVDDAAAWQWNGVPVHVAPFFNAGDGTPDLLFVTARFGSLAASLMVELDTERLCRAATWEGVLGMVADDLNAAHASLFRSFPLPSVQGVGMGRRLVDRDNIRGEIGDNPNLTEGQRRRLAAASDREIDDAIDACADSLEDELFRVHDELQAMVVSELAG